MGLPRYIAWVLALIFLYSSQTAVAQYVQDYHEPGFGGTFYYESIPNSGYKKVVKLFPIEVHLVYNCYYMRDICVNARNFMATSRGKRQKNPTSSIPQYMFGYDLNTGRGKKFRNFNRRKQSCPTSWKKWHACPEIGATPQRKVMRHDGQWFSNSLEPGTSVNGIRNRRDKFGRIEEFSKIRYTCDEFPAAPWVEGGSGSYNSDASETRCAGQRCGKGVNGVKIKSEQDWQAEAHGKLRAELDFRASAIDANGLRMFPEYVPKESVVLFHFDMDARVDGVAARVVTYKYSTSFPPVKETLVPQAKRRGESADTGNFTASNSTRGWPTPMTIDELLDRIKAGEASEIIVPAHDGMGTWPDLTGAAVNGTDQQFPWGFTDVEDEEYTMAPNFNGPTKPRRHGQNKREQPVARHIPPASITPLLKRASAQDLEDARAIVAEATAESSKLNKARLAQPRRNTYGLKPGSVFGSSNVAAANGSASDKVPPLLKITDAIAEAAALVAEADAVASEKNVTKRAVAASATAGTYWMQSLARKGTVPWGNDPNYVVFRNVLKYGAVGDGITDDTKAIKNAMNNGTRCGEKCNGSTTKNAIVYFPPGTYLISSTIPMPFGTQVIGDAIDRPVLLAAPSFVGLGVLSTDEYTGGNGGAEEYYVDTANFYRQIRNIVIDITQAPTQAPTDGPRMACLHYQVAQATSLQNVELRAAAGSSQVGMFAENGSGGQISDVTFTGGAIGLYGGNQQFTAQRLTFNGCTTGIQVVWDWGWVWKSITMTNVKVGFKLISDDGTGNIGSVSILDSKFSNVDTVVLIAPVNTKPGTGSTGVVLENIALSGVTAAVADTSGKKLLDGSAPLIGQWVIGPVYEGSSGARSFAQGAKIGNYRRHSTLVDANGTYFERQKPQYEQSASGDFVHLKDYGCTGDGTTDDTVAFQAALYASLGRILFVDAGTYILTSTVTIPSGAKIVGETWSQLVASGSYFQDASNPKVLIKVGNDGDIGSVEMQDLLFTTRGATAGLILIQWNIQAENPGSAALWDCHARIGGATGSQLTPAECPALTSGINPGCSAASLMMHLMPNASGYFENMWLWGADHMLDDPALNDPANEMVQTSVYIARGFLIESTYPTWLYATASEHAVFYQYNFHGAKNIFAGMLQTESPYFQPIPPPPAPFAAVVGQFPGDPDYKCASNDEFSGCDESWAVIIRKSANIFIAGAGVYSWFSTYSQTCIDTQLCQKSLLLLAENLANVRIQNLITIGSKYMGVMDGKGIPALDNLNVATHPDWSQISILDVSGSGTQGEIVWIDPSIWNMDQPQFTCVAPCTVMIPPWTGATSTVNYPLVTVSDGTWTSTITIAPLTVSQCNFELVTLTADASNQKAKRAQGFTGFWPVPAATQRWPAVVYTGMDGLPTTTRPTVAYPTSPPSIGPDAAAPPQGSWPKRGISPYNGWSDYPAVKQCSWQDLTCNNEPVVSTGDDTPTSNRDDDYSYNEDEEDEDVICPLVDLFVRSDPSATTTTTTAAPTTTTTAKPKPTFASGNPMDNKVTCYNRGEMTERDRMAKSADSFCSSMGDNLKGENYYYASSIALNTNGGFGYVVMMFSFEIGPGCEWQYDKDECVKYLLVAADSCDCKGVNGKHGGVVKNKCYTWMMDPNLKL